MTRQTIKECNEIIAAKDKRIVALENMVHRMCRGEKEDAKTISDLTARVAKEQQFVFQQQATVTRLQDEKREQAHIIEDLQSQVSSLEGELDDINDCCRDYTEEGLELKAKLETCYEVETELRDYIQTLLDTIDEKEKTLNTLDVTIGDLCKLCADRYNQIKALESSVMEVVDVNLQQRELLDEGVVVAENTMDMLNKYQPCINAYKTIVHLIERDTHKLHNVLDDAVFLDALYPSGGENIRAIVRLILSVVP